eukprot:366001-Chlamydomonas_euryale.AAC.6
MSQDILTQCYLGNMRFEQLFGKNLPARALVVVPALHTLNGAYGFQRAAQSYGNLRRNVGQKSDAVHKGMLDMHCLRNHAPRVIMVDVLALEKGVNTSFPGERRVPCHDEVIPVLHLYGPRYTRQA